MPTPNKTTQDFLPIEEIRDGVALLKNGNLVMARIASSLNFALKSADEQQAIIMQYQNFINSLDFSVQIYIQSRRLDIRPYLALLENRLKEQVNELLKIQISEYIDFIKAFVEMTNIMSKTFYIAVPFIPIGIGGPAKNIIGKITGLFHGKKAQTQIMTGVFEEYKNQLWQRVETVIEGLRRISVRAAPLNTEELIELSYSLYNPSEFTKTAAQQEESWRMKQESWITRQPVRVFCPSLIHHS